jgi:hypothetical protein
LRTNYDITTALRQPMHQDLQLAGLSERTQQACLHAVRQLADHFQTAAWGSDLVSGFS